MHFLRSPFAFENLPSGCDVMSTVEWLQALPLHNKKNFLVQLSAGAFLCGAQKGCPHQKTLLPMSSRAFSGYCSLFLGFSGFVLQPKSTHVWSSGDFQTVRWSERDCWLVQGTPHLLSHDTWDRLQPLYDPEQDKAATENGWRVSRAM